jgi:gamma-glutamyltranspeptidase/glutathione hydrolase
MHVSMVNKLSAVLTKRPPFKGAFLFLLLILFVQSASGRVEAQAAIASAHPMATQAGLEILQAGGNAFDAAVTVTAVLAVVEPYGSGIGGGGFYLLHRSKDGYEIMLDARERAPLASTRDMYLDEHGNPVEGLSINGPLAAGIPGIPAALEELASRYGRLSLEQTLAPAIRAAQQGFAVDEHYRRMAGFRQEALRASPDAQRIFLQDGAIPAKGSLIKQPDLATTLELIASQGGKGFYQGELAQKLVEGVQEAGGIWTLEDLKNYRLLKRKPVYGTYKGLKITAAAPPSSGGVALVQMLNILEGFDLEKMDELGRTQKIVEAMRRAYRDRAEFLGDPDFFDVPVSRLTDKVYASKQAATIQVNRATPSSELPHIAVDGAKGADTTHFSILDSEGNRVSATLSINYPFGSCFVPPGTGVLLNDEMDDFSMKPGVPNVYGLVGAEANAIEPGKRMLSSMTPVFVENERRLGILGTPGGSRIITMALLGTLDFVGDASATEIVSRARYHHQYLPDVLQFEPGAFDTQIQQELNQMGYMLKAADHTYGNMQAIVINKQTGQVEAASDPRGIGAAQVLSMPARTD